MAGLFREKIKAKWLRKFTGGDYNVLITSKQVGNIVIEWVNRCQNNVPWISIFLRKWENITADSPGVYAWGKICGLFLFLLNIFILRFFVFNKTNLISTLYSEAEQHLSRICRQIRTANFSAVNELPQSVLQNPLEVTFLFPPSAHRIDSKFHYEQICWNQREFVSLSLSLIVQK